MPMNSFKDNMKAAVNEDESANMESGGTGVADKRITQAASLLSSLTGVDVTEEMIMQLIDELKSAGSQNTQEPTDEAPDVA